MTNTMRKRRGFKQAAAPQSCSVRHQNIRRETFITVPSSQLPQLEEEEETDSSTPSRLDLTHDPLLLQTNGKLPMWSRKLAQGGVSCVVQSDADPRQVRSRWAEQLNPPDICSEEEEEEDFHPQSLESMLEDEEEEEEEDEEEEEKEVLQDPDEKKSTFILYPNTNNTTDREFDVEGVTEPQGPLTQLEVKGSGAEPVWSSQLSPDSACSEGSTGSLEQQQDADTDSLSQGSSVGSLLLEDDDDRNSLKSHFDTLACSLSDEKFDTDLKTLQPQEETPFLNPRLSISARFLSRFQNRIRAWPSQAPPTVSIPSRIAEESVVSNTSVNSESSSDVPAVVPVQTEDVSTDAASRLQQGAPRLGYLGTTASSRAKLQDPPACNTSTCNSSTCNSSTSCQEDQSQTTPVPPLTPSRDQDCSVVLPSLDPPHTPLQVSTPPTQVSSEGGASRWSVSSVDETPTNRNQTLVISPAPSPATPSTCDITVCSALRQEEADPGNSGAHLPSSSSSPLTETPNHPLTGSGGEQVSLQTCQQAAAQLKETARWAARLYRQVKGAELQEAAVLREAFEVVQSELQVALMQTVAMSLHLGKGAALQQQGGGALSPHPGKCALSPQLGEGAMSLQQSEGAMSLQQSEGALSPQLGEGAVSLQQGDSAMSLQLGEVAMLSQRGEGALTPHLGEGAMSLLEKYSELLLQMTLNKLNRI